MYVRYTKNLKNSNYKKPTGGSITDNLQNTTAMKEKLKNYVRVDNIDEVPIGTHLRYITWKDGMQKFRLGGLLKKNEKDYIRLSSKDFHWSVQKKHFDQKGGVVFETVFFKKISQDLINKNVISKLQMEIDRLTKENNIMRQKLGIGNMRIV